LTADHFKILSFCKLETKQSKEIIQDCLGLSFQTRSKRMFLKPLLDLGLLEWTDSENPKNRNQRYRLTKLGKQQLSKKS
jgi:predicted transcriptional regulator